MDSAACGTIQQQVKAAPSVARHLLFSRACANATRGKSRALHAQTVARLEARLIALANTLIAEADPTNGGTTSLAA